MFENLNSIALIIIVAAAAGLFFISYKLSKKHIRDFAENRLWENLLNADFIKILIKNICFIIALFFIVLALARPKWGIKQTESKSLSSDIVIALDVSKSMMAQDLKPDRLTRAKIVFKDLSQQLKGQRIGLIAFAGQAYWQCPLTSDIKAFEMFLSLLDSETVVFQGTNIASAIELACASLEKIPSNAKAVVLITDGESFDGNLDKAIQTAKDASTKVFTVGIGTSKGEPVPIYENGQFKEYLKDERGKTVVTKLDSGTLERIAFETGAKYYNLNAVSSVNDLSDRLNKLDKIEGTANIFNNLEDRFYYPLAVAIIFLLIYIFIPSNKKSLKNESKK